MKVGFVGTGKLGLPVSLVYASKGHEMFCYDVNKDFYSGEKHLYDLIHSEELCVENKRPLREWLPPRETLSYKHTSLKEIVEQSDLIFLAVQTPHAPEYEGVTRLPEKRVDFNYNYLREALFNLSEVIEEAKKTTPVVVISTVLPGTMRRMVLPFLSKYVKLCYNPYFIAMGTVAYDCLNPEFILLGNHDAEAAALVTSFYKTICNAEVYSTTVENAEMIKVCYNTFISTKLAMTNTIMELCHYSPNTNCDDVMRALCKASHRLISPAYLTGGMGDGGGCHPRDNIALSWYSQQKGLSYDWFENIMISREREADFFAGLIEKEARASGKPVILLGIAFKPGTAIMVGSHAALLSTILKERGIEHTIHDPNIEAYATTPLTSAVYFIGCKHKDFYQYKLPDDSIVLDPHRCFSSIAFVSKGKYIPIGIGEHVA